MSALAERLAGVPDSPAEGLPALQAAQRIRTWREVLHAMSATAEAQVMASCWAIRREHVDREAFDAFVARHLDGVLRGDQAWALADTWDAARRNRGIRDLASTRPDEAVALVTGYAEAVPDGGFDEDDRELVELLAAPPRKRRTRLRELRAAAMAARENRDPEDVRRIRELEGERDDALVQARIAGAGGAIDPMELLAEDERRLSARADEFDGLRGRLSDGARDRLLRLADMAMGSLERISWTLQQDGETE